jgi:hypothetical protein
VSDEFVIDGKIRVVQRGRDGFAYGIELIKETIVTTNLANGKYVTFDLRGASNKDLKVTDNGDGTLTVLVRAVGNAVLYGSDGEAIARDPGQSRFAVLLDHGGTPTDPSDDELIRVEGVSGSTGRTDDFCAATIAALS